MKSNKTNNIRYEILSAERVDEAAEIVADAFASREPMAAHLKISRHDLKTFIYSLCRGSINQNLSMVAIDATFDAVIGAVLTHDPRLSPPFSDLPESMSPIFQLLNEIEHESDMPDKAYVEQFMLAVNSDYENKGIITEMSKFARANYVKEGYKCSIGTATSPITYHMAEKMVQQGEGVFCQTKYYDEFSYKGNRIFQGIDKNLPSHIQWLTGRPRYGLYIRNKF